MIMPKFQINLDYDQVVSVLIEELTANIQYNYEMGDGGDPELVDAIKIVLKDYLLEHEYDNLINDLNGRYE